MRFEAERTDVAFPTVLNLSGDGTVQHVWPRADNRDPVEWTQAGPFTFTAPVTAPFGSDTLVFIETGTALPDLHRSLAALDGRTAPLEAYDALRRALNGIPFRIGLHATFTCERLENGRCPPAARSPSRP